MRRWASAGTRALASVTTATLVTLAAGPAAAHHVGAYVPRDNEISANFKQIKFAIQARKLDIALRLFESGALRAEMRAQKLRDVLQLRPNQEPALAELQRAMAPPADARERMRAGRAEMSGLTTPQRLDKMRERMARRQQEFDRKAMAIKKFYAQLTPAQQKSFDAMGPMMGRGMGGKMDHGGRMGGGHMGGHGMGYHGGPGMAGDRE